MTSRVLRRVRKKAKSGRKNRSVSCKKSHAQFQQFAANPFSSPEPIVRRHLVFSRQSFLRRPWACELEFWICTSSTGERARDATASLVSGCTITRACCQVRTSLASRTRRLRSVLVQAGRFTCRLKTMSCCRKRAFSATSSVLLLPRSASVPSGKEEESGFVQRAMREASECQQPSFNCWRWVKTATIEEVSPSHKSLVFRA